MDTLRERAVAALPVPPSMGRVEPAGQEKMSKILTDFAEPMIKSAKGEAKIREIIALAVVAWNISLSREWAQMPKTLAYIASLSPEMREMLAMLLERRNRVYPTVRRLIMDYEVVRETGAYRLNVASVNFDAKLPPPA